MPITHITPENISKYLCAAGSGSKEAIKNATSPNGILEWIVNFFTFGGVRRSNERCFQQVLDKLTLALVNVDEEAFYSGTRIFLGEMNGGTTRLVCGAAFDDKGPMVTIEVSKNGNIVEKQVDGEIFWAVCRMLKLMSTYNIEQPNSLLTEEGFLNLRGLNLSHKNFQGVDLSETDASGTNFCGTNLSDVKIHHTRLRGANLCGAILCRANISFVTLTEASLADANLTDAVMDHVDLTGANMYHADLTRVALTNVNLDDAECAMVDSTNSGRPEANQSDMQVSPAPPGSTNENLPTFLPGWVG